MIPRRSPFTLLALASLSACAYRPPFTRPPGAPTQADPRQAKLVFLWPEASCDPAGYLTLTTTDGRFLGNVSRGTRLSVLVPPGESTIVAWDEVMEATSGTSPWTVAVVHGDLQEGRTYYARVAFGMWTASGPRGPAPISTPGRRYSARGCIAVQGGTASALVAVAPQSDDWRDLSGWLSDLRPIESDRDAGQAWLDGHRASLELRVAAGRARLAGLRPDGMKLATLEPAGDAPPP